MQNIRIKIIGILLVLFITTVGISACSNDSTDLVLPLETAQIESLLLLDTNPINFDKDVPLGYSPSASFNQILLTSSQVQFALFDSDNVSLEGTSSINGKTINFDPSLDLLNNATYRAQVLYKPTADTILAEATMFEWQFTTIGTNNGGLWISSHQNNDLVEELFNLSGTASIAVDQVEVSVGDLNNYQPAVGIQSWSFEVDVRGLNIENLSIFVRGLDDTGAVLGVTNIDLKITPLQDPWVLQDLGDRSQQILAVWGTSPTSVIAVGGIQNTIATE